MHDRSKTVVLIACAAQAVIVAVTIAWVAATGSGHSDSAVAQTENASLSESYKCDAHGDGRYEDPGAYGDYGAYGESEVQNGPPCEGSESSGGAGTSQFGNISLY
jgi:hypothetical protein